MRIVLAFRAFFAVLFRADCAERIRVAMECAGESFGKASDKASSIDANAGKNSHGSSKAATDTAREMGTAKEMGGVLSSTGAHRSDALTVLSVLQREARLLDLVSETLDAYTDEQIGGAARDVLRDTQKSLQHMFGLQPLLQAAEGDSVSIPTPASPMRWRVAGNSGSERGTLAHAGWIATRVDLPKWTGAREDAWVIAPAEVETRS